MNRKGLGKRRRKRRRDRKFREPRRRNSEGQPVGPPTTRCPYCGTYLRENESEVDNFVVHSLDCPECGKYSKYLKTTVVINHKRRKG